MQRIAKQPTPNVVNDIRCPELPADPITRADIEHVLEHGYVALPDVFTQAEAEEAKAELARLSGEQPLTGRNAFEGLDTTRIYSLLNKTRVMDKFCVLPRVLALNDYFLDPGYMISAFHSIQINPGEKAQNLHHGLSHLPYLLLSLIKEKDDGFIGLSRPRPALGTAIIVALDEFTKQNGATRIVPGSHKWDSNRRPTEEEAIPMTCAAGSVLYFISLTWHSGGQNQSDKPRMSGTVQYCQPYIRPIENQILAVDPRRLDEIPERIVDMMGYRTHDPFIGYSDGLNPRKAAKRMTRWLQKPLANPPTFAIHEDSKL